MNRPGGFSFELSDGFARCLAATILSVTLFVLPGRTENCPPDAVTTGLYLSVAAYRTNGLPIRNEEVRVGESICLTSAVVFVPLNVVDYSPSASFSGGTMTIGGDDVTPLGGVPLVGYPECGGTNFAVSKRFERRVTLADALAGSIYITARYSNAMSRVAATVRINVRPWTGPVGQLPKPPVPRGRGKPPKPKLPVRWAGSW